MDAIEVPGYRRDESGSVVSTDVEAEQMARAKRHQARRLANLETEVVILKRRLARLEKLLNT